LSIRRSSSAAVLCGLVPLCVALAAAGAVPDVPHTAEQVKIDGVLDELVWRSALVFDLNVETNPLENQPAPVKTKAYLAENGDMLLVAFVASDPDPDKIRAYLRDRDAAYNDDFVGVVLDTFNDARRAFEFFANPLGVQMDLTNDDVNRREDDSWDAIWQSAGRITETGYTVEMGIPFSQLRFPSARGEQTWGVDLLRFYPRGDRVRLSNNPMDRGRNCYLCQFAKVRGFADAEPGKDLEVAPEVTATRTDTRDDDRARLVNGEVESAAGLNLSWGVTPDMTANLALNPDFSQVEADVAQLDVNNQFALFFPETRPFFLEGADYFATPINAVFTRTVADPDIGAKLTGKHDNNTFGVFAAEDAVTDLLFPGALQSSNDELDQQNRSFVGRYRRGFGNASTIGALVTTRSGDGYRNDVAGIDGRMRVNDRHNVTFQYLGSRTEYPDAVSDEFDQPTGPFSGNALQVDYGYSTRNWFANIEYSQRDPGFRADSGFVTRVDTEETNINAGHVWQGDGTHWWNQLRVGANANTAHDRAGRLLSRDRQAFFAFQGPMQSFVQLGVFAGKQLWDDRLFTQRGVFMYGQARPRGGLNLSVSINSGDQIDYDNSRLGEQLRIQPSVEWNANRHLLLRLRHTSLQLNSANGSEILDAELSDLRLTWQFNVRSFLRLTVQRQHVERNLDLYEDPDTDPHSLSIASQLLYSYKLNPQTVFFAGYSDNELQNLNYPDVTRTDRTFFLKLSYAWIPR
jgi:hypothetical protein